MRDRRLIPGPGIELWIATVGIGAFLLGGLVHIDRSGPRIGSVRLDDLAAEMVQRTIQAEASDQAVAGRARTWAAGLERALDAVARRHEVVLLPAQAVAAGAPDYTDHVREALAAWEASYAGRGAAVTDGHRSDVAVHGAGQREGRP